MGRCIAAQFAFVFVGLAMILAGIADAASSDWATFREPAFSGSIDYPIDMFEELPGAPGDTEHRFVSNDGGARMAVGAWLNSDSQTPGDMKNSLLSRSRERSVTYQPRGRSWFVMSGYQGQNIYYEKVMYSCGGRVITAFGLTYPIALRAAYDPVVERMENSFRPGRRCP